MVKKDLLAEAIADAKKVKATAYANAKLALEEAFQPTLQRMLSNKISEEEEGDDDEDFDIDINVMPEEPAGEEPIGMGSFDAGDDEPAPDAEPPLDGDEDEEPRSPELESLIRELEGTEEDDDEFMGEGEEEDWQDPIPDEPVREGDGYDDDTELTEAEVNALATFLEDAGLGDLDAPEDDGGGAYEKSVPSSNLNLENRRLRRENAQLRKRVSEALATVTSVKKTINEVNLLNAKLMYTTKALKTGGLTESQQIRVMQAIDRGNSVREVKLIYTSIIEAMNQKPSKRLTEGLASKSSRALNPSSTNRSKLNESVDSDVIRWQRLANIIPPADY